jgi:small subunit ribosomal protein S20
MPNTKSAKKRMKTNQERNVRNRGARTKLRSALKKANSAVEAGDPAAVQEASKQALTLIGKTAQKGIIHRNKAARQESRLQKKINAVKPSA